jgi:hypothetical protein
MAAAALGLVGLRLVGLGLELVALGLVGPGQPVAE